MLYYFKEYHKPAKREREKGGFNNVSVLLWKSSPRRGAAFVAPNATVQGDVILKAGSTVWYGAVLRGDDGTLTIGENSNVQDNAVLHCDVGGAVMLGKSVTVGHGALVHGCTVGMAV